LTFSGNDVSTTLFNTVRNWSYAQYENHLAGIPIHRIGFDDDLEWFPTDVCFTLCSGDDRTTVIKNELRQRKVDSIRVVNSPVNANHRHGLA